MDDRRPSRSADDVVIAPVEVRWHVFNLPYDATEHDLKQLFADLGRVGERRVAEALAGGLGAGELH